VTTNILLAVISKDGGGVAVGTVLLHHIAKGSDNMPGLQIRLTLLKIFKQCLLLPGSRDALVGVGMLHKL